jgi:hypothetical protein
MSSNLRRRDRPPALIRTHKLRTSVARRFVIWGRSVPAAKPMPWIMIRNPPDRPIARAAFRAGLILPSPSH